MNYNSSLFYYDADINYADVYGLKNPENSDYFIYGKKNDEYLGIIFENGKTLNHSTYNKNFFDLVRDRFLKKGWINMDRDDILKKSGI